MCNYEIKSVLVGLVWGVFDAFWSQSQFQNCKRRHEKSSSSATSLIFGVYSSRLSLLIDSLTDVSWTTFMLFWSTHFDKAKLVTFAKFLANLSYIGRQHLFLQPGSPRIEDAVSQGRIIPFRDKFMSAFPSERWVNFNWVHLGLLPFPKSPYCLQL